MQERVRREARSARDVGRHCAAEKWRRVARAPQAQAVSEMLQLRSLLGRFLSPGAHHLARSRDCRRTSARDWCTASSFNASPPRAPRATFDRACASGPGSSARLFSDLPLDSLRRCLLCRFLSLFSSLCLFSQSLPSRPRPTHPHSFPTMKTSFSALSLATVLSSTIHSALAGATVNPKNLPHTSENGQYG